MNTMATFYSEHYYHIYNRTNNKEMLFKAVPNRTFFLMQYKKYLCGFLEIHAYALMGNHFHFSVRIKSKEKIDQYLSDMTYDNQTVAIKNYLDSSEKEEQIHPLIVGQHRRFFISYSQAINKMYSRQGNLFNAKFKRSQFDPNKKFKHIQYYLHHNARKHGIVRDFKKYRFTSYHEIIDGNNWLIDIDHVLSRFLSIKEFIEYHDREYFTDDFESFIYE